MHSRTLGRCQAGTDRHIQKKTDLALNVLVWFHAKPYFIHGLLDNTERVRELSRRIDDILCYAVRDVFAYIGQFVFAFFLSNL